MKGFSKGLILDLIVAFFWGFMFIGTSYAATPDPNAPVPVPSVPEFTVTHADHSYDVPATTTSHKDPYTGKVTTETRPGYHVQNFTIDLTISNQAFPSSIDGHILGVRYFIESKGNFEDNWHHQEDIDTQSTSGYTIISIPANSFPAEGKVDFRIKAWLGFYTPGSNKGPGVPAAYLWPRESDWSSIKTINLADGSTSISPSSTPNPTSPPTSIQPTPETTMYPTNPTGIALGFELKDLVIVVLGALLAVAVLAIVILLRLKRKM